jgi:hypothetical protein
MANVGPVQPSLRDLGKAKWQPGTLKGWAIVGMSLRDKAQGLPPSGSARGLAECVLVASFWHPFGVPEHSF